MDSSKKYAAFISYRHVSPDKYIAKALQLMLEYNLVRPNKSVPRHIRKVFLDTSELPTLEDLDSGILNALDDSECLYVICSPDLPKSKYCMREISHFKQRHGGSLNRVATLLVRGEPQEAYPEILRTQTVPDPDAPDKTTEVEVEPLFADVRGRNLIHSLWKLFISEYLRLAAKYYQCSYDDLKKRHKRNLIYMLTLAMVAIFTISGVLIHKDQQVQTTRANTYASYANEQTLLGDELKAMALCTHTDCAHTDEFTTALRSAVVQREMKLRNTPVSRIMETTYHHDASSNYYISASGNLLVVADGKNWQVTDAYTGSKIRQFPFESAFVMGQHPEKYVVLDSRPNEKGVFFDYVSVIDLETDQLISEFPFRIASSEETDYHVISLAESNYTLNMVTDRGESVAYFTDEGVELSELEFMERLIQFQKTPNEHNDPYRVVRNKLKKTYVVKDSAGAELLNLGDNCQNYVFSGDWKLFAAATDNILSVYDTENWALLGQTELDDVPQSIHLLSGSSYCVIGSREGASDFWGQDTQSLVMDWRTGKVFLTAEGSILMNPAAQIFYTVLEGNISGYSYADLDISRQFWVLSHSQDICLSSNSDDYQLSNTATQKTLLNFEAQEVRSDENLTRILAQQSQGLTCFDNSGAQLWSVTADAKCVAVSPDGSRCAWLDGQNNVHILFASDGSEIDQISSSRISDAGDVRQIIISDTGLGVLGEDSAIWIPDGSDAPIPLGSFTRGTLFSDGILILESDARVHDFHIYDTTKDFSFLPFADNTGNWAYAPETGYLVRHIESTGNNASAYLEIWSLKNQEADYVDRIELPDNDTSFLSVDGAGEYLSFSSGGRSFVYALEEMLPILNVQGQLYLEANVLYGKSRFGDYHFRMPMYDTETLLELAEKVLTSPAGKYTLTEEDKRHYLVS